MMRWQVIAGAALGGALALSALLAWVGAQGYQRGLDAASEALDEAETDTKERINAQPVFTDDDDGAWGVLCRIANLADCPVRRDDTKPQEPRRGPH